MKHKILILTIVLAVCFMSIASSSFADDYNSERYKIQFGNINIGGDNLNSSNYDLSVSIGQTAAGEFQSQGYVVKAGFQYIHSIIPFFFSISNININLGTLTPNVPSSASTALQVSFGGAGQYQVTTAETNPLQTLSGSTIPNTACDGGVNTCSVSSAKLWNSNSAYGFGYNMSGDDIPPDFVSSSYFRPFPDLSLGENPQVVMSSQNVGRGRQSTVTFKANIPTTQQVGSYQTVIKFTATPSY